VHVYTKESLIERLRQIRNRGWIRSGRQGNDGGVGNTLEDLLGIEENNLPMPNAAEWELKTQRLNTSALTTLFHMEPSPTAMKMVTRVLLPKYGWASKSHIGEYSFRQTINGRVRTNRGFGIEVDETNKRVVVSFRSSSVDTNQHATWLKSVEERTGLDEINPQPYWGFDDLFHKAGTKLLNCFYVRANCKRVNGVEFFNYAEIKILEKFSLSGFLSAIKEGKVYVDFDARTGHNHGTKFRLAQNAWPDVYESVKDI
jgi:hypothetical protein